MTLTPMDRRPVDDGYDEYTKSKRNRDDATALAYDTVTRPALRVRANPEELDNHPHPISNFTKGLPHNIDGNVGPKAYDRFVKALRMPNQLGASGGFPAPLGPDGSLHPAGYDATRDTVPDKNGNPGEAPFTKYHFRNVSAPDEDVNTRMWESPLGGLNSDITGPSIGGVSLPPAPVLGSSELCAEMAEVYAMALMRDVSFSALQNLETTVPNTNITIGDIVSELGNLPWHDPNGRPTSSEKTSSGKFSKKLTAQEERRRAAKWDINGAYSAQSLFRGSTIGAKKGPYLSQ